MKLKQYQVDAFASKVFQGNPAAVCPLDKWLDAKQISKRGGEISCEVKADRVLLSGQAVLFMEAEIYC